MREQQAKFNELLTLPDEAYTDLSPGFLRDLQVTVGRALRGPFPPPPGAAANIDPTQVLLTLGAPTRVATESTSLTALVGVRQSGLRAWQIERQQNLWLLVSDLTSGEQSLRIASSAKGKRMAAREPSASGVPPDDTERRAQLTSLIPLQLHEMLGSLPATSTRLALTAIYLDRFSDTRVVKLERDKPATSAVLPDAAGVELLPSTSNTLSAQAKEAGLVFTVPEKTSRRGDIRLEGALDLPAEKAVVLETSEGPRVRVDLILLQLDDRDPWQLELLVPATLVKADDRVQATFAVNLGAAAEAVGRKISGNYQVFTSAGAVVSGPRALVIN